MSYKVKVISLLLLNNVIVPYGTEIEASQLTDSAENLVKGGYLEEVVPVGPSAAELQLQADAQKLIELGNAKTALDNATNALTAAQTAAAAATPETKDALDAAVVTATADLQNAQAAFDAIAPKGKK